MLYPLFRVSVEGGTLANTLVTGKKISVKIEDGYNAAYYTINTKATIQGPLMIRTGTVRIKILM